MSLDSVNIRLSNAENNIINSINRNSIILNDIDDNLDTHKDNLQAIENAVESIDAKVSTEAQQILQLDQEVVIATNSSSINNKLSKGEDLTITGGTGGLQQILLYGRDNTTNLHPIRITPQGDIDVEIADFVKGQDTMSQSFPVTISSDQSNINVANVNDSVGDGSTQTSLPRNTIYGCYNNADLRSVKIDSTGRLLVQVEGVRQSGSETINIPDSSTISSSAIIMGTHTRIAFYGDTDNTTNTNIFIEYSQDGVNWFRGAGDNAKIIVVSASGNFYDEEIVTTPRVRISRPNTSGSAETLQLYYTQL